MIRFLVITSVFLVVVGTIVTITASAGSRWQLDNRSGDTATIDDINPPTTTITINDDYTVMPDSSEGVVTFPDPGLEAAIRQAIDKPQGPIYITDLSSLAEL